MKSWTVLFRSLAVPGLLFFVPLLVVPRVYSLSLYLPPAAIVSLLSLQVLLTIAIFAAGAALLATALAVAGRVGLIDTARFIPACGGLLTLLVIVVSFVELPLSGYLISHFFNALTFISGHRPSRYPEYVILWGVVGAAPLGAILFRKVWPLAKFDELNRSVQWIVPVAVILMAGGFWWGNPGWRWYDRAPSGGPMNAGASARPNVIIISLDALSAQDVSVDGYHLRTTPWMERLAGHAYNFTHCSAVCSFTTPAVTSIMTGKYPISHRVWQLEGRVPRNQRDENLAQLLRDHGYSTAAIVENPFANPLTIGIDRSFSYIPKLSYFFSISSFLLQSHDYISVHELFGDLIAQFVTNLRRLSKSSKGPSAEQGLALARTFLGATRTPFFLWVHLQPPHAPYITAPQFRGRFLSGADFTSPDYFLWDCPIEGPYRSSEQALIDKLRLRYDERILEADTALAEFEDWLEVHGRRNTILIVTSDHGESFHHWFQHNSPDLYYAELHVPLLISLPGQSKGFVRTEDVDSTDIAPTVLRLLGIAQPAWMDGHPLLSDQAKGDRQPGFAFYLARSRTLDPPTQGTIAATEGDYQLTWYFPEGRERLFDIAADPDQNHDLARERPGVAAALRAKIHQRFGQFPGFGVSPEH